MNKEITIFTDGSSRGNPGPGGWGAIVVYNNSDKQLTTDNQQLVQELGGGEKLTTNNRMELTAVIKSLDFINKQPTTNNKQQIKIHTDSSYVLNGATKWMHGWQKNNWRTKDKKQVMNQDLWEKLVKVLGEPRTHLSTKSAEERPQLHVEWKLIKGHAGIAGNERCDVIATTFADGKKSKLYVGSLKEYSVDLAVRVSAKPERLLQKSKTRTGKPFSYVSSVNGVVKMHATWAECEKRVKGVSGTKYKKSFSAEDEKAIVASWKASH